MDAADYQRELKEYERRLAGELGHQAVPDDVWGHVMKHEFVYDAIIGDDASWQELVDEAKARLRESLEETGSRLPPGRGTGEGAHGAPHEIAVDVSEKARMRAEAFAEVAANMAHSNPGVRRFRKKHLRNSGLLSEEEARAFLDEHGGPHSTALVVRQLLKLADQLVKTYRWRRGDAAWFVLTGLTPPTRPLEVGGLINNAPKHPGTPQTLIPDSSPPRYIAAVPRARDYHPSTAYITITADVWVDAREVEKAYRDAQRQILGGDARQLPDCTLEVAKFVSRRMRDHPGEPWAERLRAWNEAYPPGCQHYKDHRSLSRPFEEKFAYREYNLPNWRGRETRTPYEEYEADWWRRRSETHEKKP